MSSLYLYGITRPRELPKRLQRRGIVLVGNGERAAIVSAVEEGPVEATRKNLLAHADVVEHLHEEGVVLPARFGTVLDGEDSVRELLAVSEIERLLDENASRSQLNLGGRYEESVIGEVAGALRGLRDAYRAAPTVDNGVALGEAVGELLAERAQRDAAVVLDRVEPLCVAVRSGEPTGELAAFAFELLVERSRADAVGDAVGGLARELSPPLHFRLVGPLPPYGFVELAPPVAA